MSEKPPFESFIIPFDSLEPDQTDSASGKNDSVTDPPLNHRKRGAQPGNLNALKHGLYVNHGNVINLTPVERAQLCDLKDLITHFKQYMEHLYTVGMQSKDLAEINETLRSMSIASMALTRLINVQEDNYSFAVPDAKRKHYQSPTDRATFSALARLLSASNFLSESFLPQQDQK